MLLLVFRLLYIWWEELIIAIYCTVDWNYTYCTV